MMLSQILVLCLICIVGLCADVNRRNVTVKHMHPDVGLNAKQLIKKYGYPFENHTVVTKDGYLLDMHRIPHGRNQTGSTTRIPVLFVSGLLCGSADWVNMGPDKSLGFILADNGYDVWLANYRGTRWSRKHVTLNPDKDRKEYWSFSFQEIGNFDLPAFIEHILNVTEQETLFYIGHSQGTSSLFALLSDQPQYNAKIRQATLLSPVAFVGNSNSIVVKKISEYRVIIELFVEHYNMYEFLPWSPITTLAGQLFCNDDSPFQTLCALLFYVVAGFNPKQLNRTMIPVITSNTPAGSSIIQLLHYIQIYESGFFRKYDYGEDENLRKYEQKEPPEYNLSRIAIPLAVFYGNRDVLVHRKDVEHFVSEVPNVILKKLLRGFNHLDYMWGNDAPKLIYNDILRILETY